MRPHPTPSLLHCRDVRINGAGPKGSKKFVQRAGSTAPPELLWVRELEALFSMYSEFCGFCSVCEHRCVNTCGVPVSAW